MDDTIDFDKTLLANFAKAFELWEAGYRAEPENFLTADELKEMQVSEIAAASAEQFLELLKTVEKQNGTI